MMKLFFQKIQYEILASEFNYEVLEVRRIRKLKSKFTVVCFIFVLIAAHIYRYRKR